MLCEKCQVKKSTVHLIPTIKQEGIQEKHYCESCAKELGFSEKFLPIDLWVKEGEDYVVGTVADLHENSIELLVIQSSKFSEGTRLLVAQFKAKRCFRKGNEVGLSMAKEKFESLVSILP